MNKRISVGIDLDDTLNNLVDVWLKVYNKKWKDNLTKEDIHGWMIADYVKPEARETLFNILGTKNFFKKLGVQPYAKEVTDWLAQYVDLYIVTAYDYRSCKDKAEFVIANLPAINPKNIIFCNNKSLLDLDFLIDDGSHNLEEFKRTGLLFDKPWNRDNTKNLRFYNWLDIKKYFEIVLNINE